MLCSIRRKGVDSFYVKNVIGKENPQQPQKFNFQKTNDFRICYNERSDFNLNLKKIICQDGRPLFKNFINAYELSKDYSLNQNRANVKKIKRKQTAFKWLKNSR